MQGGGEGGGTTSEGSFLSEEVTTCNKYTQAVLTAIRSYHNGIPGTSTVRVYRKVLLQCRPSSRALTPAAATSRYDRGVSLPL